MNDFNSTESQLFQESPEEAAKRIIRDAAPFAAQSIVAIAGDETISPSVRLNASRYIIDRNLGPVGKDDAEKSELEAFLEQLNAEANGRR